MTLYSGVFNNMGTPTELESIFNMARNESKPTYHVYEYYKQMLHNAGYYGYERELADILGI